MNPVATRLAMHEELLARLPERMRDKIVWVYPHSHWPFVVVQFEKQDGTANQVRIPKEHWLDDWAISYLCLMAP